MLKVRAGQNVRANFLPLRSAGEKEKVDRDCIPSLWPKRVDDFDVGLFEVRPIARHDRQAMNERGRGIRLTLIGIARPEARRDASNSGQRRPDSASHGRQCSFRTPASNQRSNRLRRFPLGWSRIPNWTSPRIMGSMATSRSCFLSYLTTLGSTPP